MTKFKVIFEVEKRIIAQSLDKAYEKALRLWLPKGMKCLAVIEAQEVTRAAVKK